MILGAMPNEWKAKTIAELHAGDVPKLNPLHFPDEQFEHFSIPAYQNAETPQLARGSDILSQKLVLPPRCVLFGKLNPRVEKVWNVKSCSASRRIASTEWLPIVPKAGIDQDFIYYLMWSDWVMPVAQRLVSGSTPSRQRVEPKAFYEIVVPIPEFDEQQQIAKVLHLFQAASRNQLNCVQSLNALKRAAMRQLFTRGLRGDARKETEIGPMPESWEVASFASVREKLQYGTSVRCTYDLSDRPVLRIPNIKPQRINAKDLKYCTLTGNDAAKYRLEENDLIFIRTNGVLDRLGSCAVYTGQPAKALFASYLIRARMKLNRVNPHFIAYYFGSDTGTNTIAGRATPASDGKFNLNAAIIDSLPLPLPPTLSEQNEIVAVLDAIDCKINLHRRKRAVIDALFKALLHNLMEGQIRVADLHLPTPEVDQGSLLEWRGKDGG